MNCTTPITTEKTLRCTPASAGDLGLAGLVRLYRRHNAAHLRAELAFFRKAPSLATAVKFAALAEDGDGKCFGHQRRITYDAREQSLVLLGEAALAACDTFASLHALVTKTLAPVHGIGKLYVYDAALRVGAFLGLRPERVYLQAGALLGALELGFAASTDSIAMHDLPVELQALEPQQVEGFLCIYRDELARLRSDARSANDFWHEIYAKHDVHSLASRVGRDTVLAARKGLTVGAFERQFGLRPA